MTQEAAPVQLREVRGPSALGGGWKRAYELLSLIAVTEFRRTYFGTVFGYLWSVARPLMVFSVLLAVFTQVFRIGAEVPNYPVLLLFNLVLFGFFQEATTSAVGSIARYEGVIRKTQFPRLVIPLSVVLTSVFNLGPNLVVVFIFVIAFGVTPVWTWALLPVVLILLFVLTTAVAMIVSSLYPRFRDTQIIWTVAVTVLFYGTPVLYPLEIVPAQFREFALINPLAPLFELARSWVIDPGATDRLGGAWSLVNVIPAIAISAVICVLAAWIFNREAPRIAEEL
jgi:ABC-2 type transport system permease protein